LIQNSSRSLMPGRSTIAEAIQYGRAKRRPG
jgi:hypothetical protein